MEKRIARDAYLTYASELTQKEKDFIAEFAAWLPETIIDCHAHCNLPDHVRWVDDRDRGHMLSTFPSFDLYDSLEWNNRFHPGTDIRCLRFPNVFRGIDYESANSYLLTRSLPQDRIALFGIADEAENTIVMLSHPRVSALKMYYLHSGGMAKEIYQYFPKPVLEVAESRNIPILLHPPSRITACLGQILQVIKDFPQLRICLAHLSLTKEIVPGIEEAFTELAKFPQISFDTALVPSAEIVEMALRIVGTDRIMYGSDSPLDLIRSVPYKHPLLGERLATAFPYHWADEAEQKEFGHIASDASHAHWQTLTAIKKALSHFPSGEREEAKHKLFFSNAQSFYRF